MSDVCMRVAPETRRGRLRLTFQTGGEPKQVVNPEQTIRPKHLKSYSSRAALCGKVRLYLLSPALVHRHVTLQLGSVGEAVVAVGAAEALVRLLVAVLDVLLQRAVAFVSTGAVRTREQLGEGIRRSCLI